MADAWSKIIIHILFTIIMYDSMRKSVFSFLAGILMACGLLIGQVFSAISVSATSVSSTNEREAIAGDEQVLDRFVSFAKEYATDVEKLKKDSTYNRSLLNTDSILRDKFKEIVNEVKGREVQAEEGNSLGLFVLLSISLLVAVAYFHSIRGNRKFRAEIDGSIQQLLTKFDEQNNTQPPSEESNDSCGENDSPEKDGNGEQSASDSSSAEKNTKNALIALVGKKLWSILKSELGIEPKSVSRHDVTEAFKKLSSLVLDSLESKAQMEVAKREAEVLNGKINESLTTVYESKGFKKFEDAQEEWSMQEKAIAYLLKKDEALKELDMHVQNLDPHCNTKDAVVKLIGISCKNCELINKLDVPAGTKPEVTEDNFKLDDMKSAQKKLQEILNNLLKLRDAVQSVSQQKEHGNYIEATQYAVCHFNELQKTEEQKRNSNVPTLEDLLNDYTKWDVVSEYADKLHVQLKKYIHKKLKDERIALVSDNWLATVRDLKEKADEFANLDSGNKQTVLSDSVSADKGVESQPTLDAGTLQEERSTSVNEQTQEATEENESASQSLLEEALDCIKDDETLASLKAWNEIKSISELIKVFGQIFKKKEEDNKRLQSKTTETEGKLLEAQKKHEKEIRHQADKHNEAKRKLKETHKVEIERLQAAHEEDIKEFNRNIEDIKSAADTEINNVREKADKQLTCARNTIEANSAIYLQGFTNMLSVVDSILKSAFARYRGSSALTNLVNQHIRNNDYYSLTDFLEEFNKMTENFKKTDMSTIRTELQKLYYNCLKIDNPTWIDYLGILYAYAQVPFIAEQLNEAGVHCGEVQKSFTMLEATLRNLDFALSYPRLFIDKFDEATQNKEDFRNIDDYFTEFKEHVTDDDVIIDLHRLGAKSLTNAQPIIDKKMIVSTF